MSRSVPAYTGGRSYASSQHTSPSRVTRGPARVGAMAAGQSIRTTTTTTSTAAAAVAARVGTSNNNNNSTRSSAQALDLYDMNSVNWANLESRFDELLRCMDVTTTGINALAERAAHQERVSRVIAALLDRAQEECRRLLTSGLGEAAERSGVTVLRLRERFYGANHLQLVPAYLHLARSKQFLARYGDAEQMLALAHFIVLKRQDEVSLAMKAELHQAYGLLYAADDKLDAAVQHLTCATYCLTCLYGTRSVLTSFSYFDLANVFAAQASMESAMALYDTVKEIWYEHLTRVLDEVVAERAAAERLRKYAEDEDGGGGDATWRAAYASVRAFGADNVADAAKMLHGVYTIQHERYRGIDHPSTARAAFVLGLFLLWVNDVAAAQVHLRGARAASQRFYGPRHPIVVEVEHWCAQFGIAHDDDDDDGDDDNEGGSNNGASEQPTDATLATATT